MNMRVICSECGACSFDACSGPLHNNFDHFLPCARFLDQPGTLKSEMRDPVYAFCPSQLNTNTMHYAASQMHADSQECFASTQVWFLSLLLPEHVNCVRILNQRVLKSRPFPNFQCMDLYSSYLGLVFGNPTPHNPHPSPRNNTTNR